MNYLFQGIGFIGTALVFISFQQNTRKNILLFQIFSAAFFTVHYLCLGAYTGALMNIVGVCRSVVYYYSNDKKWASSPVWIGIFIVSFAAIVVFTWDGAKSLLPLCAMTLTTVSYRIKSPKLIRFITFPSSPMWMTYNILTHSIAGIVTEVCVSSSILIAIFRYDILKKKEKTEKEADIK